MSSKLQILQANCHNSFSNTKYLLGLAKWDIILVQEPTLVDKIPRVNGYYSLWEPNSRVVTYISKRFDISEWTLEYSSRHHQIVKLNTSLGPLYFHNIYNRQAELELVELLRGKELEGEHAFIGDFNLHHPR